MWDIIKFFIAAFIFIVVIGIFVNDTTFLKKIGKHSKEAIHSLEEGWKEGKEGSDFNKLSSQDSMLIYYNIKNNLKQ